MSTRLRFLSGVWYTSPLPLTPNELNVLVSRDQESFQCASEYVRTGGQVSDIVSGRRFPDSRAGNRERPTSIPVEPIAIVNLVGASPF